MYIISILNVATNEVELTKPFSEELEAQNHYLDKVEEIQKSDTPNVVFESLFISKTKACIYKKEFGWVKNYKEAHKIVTLHFDADHDIMER